MKYLIFGTGEYYARYKKWIAREDVVALLDNSSEKQGMVIDGIYVTSPEEAVKFSFDVVVIMSFYVKVMKKQLIELGVAEEKIYHFYDLRSLIWPPKNRIRIHCYGIDEIVLRDKMAEKIVLLSTDLDLGGTAIALFQMAKILKKQGYSIVFASMIDGALRMSLLECEIPVIVDSNLQLATMREITWMSKARLIICNAVNYHIFLSNRDTCIPTIWWLHDSAFFYDGVNREAFQCISMENLKVFAVGPVPREAIHKILPDMRVDELLYGVDNTVGM